MVISMDKDKFYDLWVLLRRSTHVIMRARDQELKKYGVSSVGAAVLDVVSSMDDKATSTAISEKLLREPHSIYLLINRMVKKGLLNKHKDAKQKNIVRVSLTEKGHEVYHHSRELVSIRNIMSSLSEEEVQMLLEVLPKMWNNGVEELAKSKNLLLLLT